MHYETTFSWLQLSTWFLRSEHYYSNVAISTASISLLLTAISYEESIERCQYGTKVRMITLF